MDDQWIKNYEQHQKELERSQATSELINMRAMLLLIQDEDLGCAIHVGALKCGVSVNERVRAVIEQEIKEIELFLAGEPNNWQ